MTMSRRTPLVFSDLLVMRLIPRTCATVAESGLTFLFRKAFPDLTHDCIHQPTFVDNTFHVLLLWTRRDNLRTQPSAANNTAPGPTKK
jgi:hypothetical protein